MDFKKIMLMTIGVIALIFGAIGIALPLLPTTPFVILAAGCFAKSSPKLYRWISNVKYFNEFIENYNSKSGVTKKTKAKAIVFLWSALIISSFFISSPWIWLLLFFIGIAVTAHVSLLETKAPGN